MKIEILKPHKLLTVGRTLDIDSEYCAMLIKKGIAKSLEPTTEVVDIPEPKQKAKK